MDIKFKDTLALAEQLHGDQSDKAGVPYTHHLARVFARLYGVGGPVLLHAAILHDAIEDASATAESLAEAGYADCVPIIEAVSRRDGESYAEFIQRIIDSGDFMAMQLKLADLMDNLAPARVVASYSESQVKKYLKAAGALMGALGASRYACILRGDLSLDGTFSGGKPLLGDPSADLAGIEDDIESALEF